MKSRDSEHLVPDYTVCSALIGTQVRCSRRLSLTYISMKSAGPVLTHSLTLFPTHHLPLEMNGQMDG